MFENLIIYMRSAGFKPKVGMSVRNLRKYLLDKGKSPRIKERMMTQYWQIDELPVESAKYWQDSEAWLRQNKPY